MRKRLLLSALFAPLVLFASSCDWYYNTWSPDDLMKAIPWFDHMIKSRAVHPYSRAGIPRTTVPGTVPITGSEGDWETEWVAGTAATADKLVNPTVPAETLVRADTLYHTFCAVCHGPVGAGDGLVGLKMGARSLLTAQARGYTDGFIYSIIRYGRGNMPRYGDKVVHPQDRWALVNYVRKLQQDAGPLP